MSTTKEPAHQGRTRPAPAASIAETHGFEVIQVDVGFERSVELGLTA
jgi:hypothetical protein